MESMSTPRTEKQVEELTRFWGGKEGLLARMERLELYCQSQEVEIVRLEEELAKEKAKYQ